MSALTGLAIVAKSLVICTNAPIIFDICTRLTIYFQQFMGFRYNFLKNSDISGTSYQNGDIQSQGIRILRGGNIQNDKLVLYDDVYLSEQMIAPLPPRLSEKSASQSAIGLLAILAGGRTNRRGTFRTGSPVI